MYRIKRTKTSQVAVGSVEMETTASHYAASVAPAGNVTAWVSSPSRAHAVTASVAATVQAFYAGNPLAGVIEVEPMEEGTDADLAGLVTDAAGVGRAEFQQLQEAYRAKASELVDLTRALDDLRGQVAEAEHRARIAEQRLAEQDTTLGELQRELSALRSAAARGTPPAGNPEAEGTGEAEAAPSPRGKRK